MPFVLTNRHIKALAHLHTSPENEPPGSFPSGVGHKTLADLERHGLIFFHYEDGEILVGLTEKGKIS